MALYSIYSKNINVAHGFKSTLRNRVPHKFFSSIVINIFDSIWIVGVVCDNVNSRGEFFCVYMEWFWGKARLASKKSGEKVKFKWVDGDGRDTEYFLSFIF
jgi:hypothetical protein